MKNHTFIDYAMYAAALITAAAYIGLAYKDVSAGYGAAIWPVVSALWYHLYITNRKN